jgi:hypothetical protein
VAQTQEEKSMIGSIIIVLVLSVLGTRQKKITKLIIGVIAKVENICFHVSDKQLFK